MDSQTRYTQRPNNDCRVNKYNHYFMLIIHTVTW